MWVLRILTLLALAGVCAKAQVPTPPGQPTSGPGGSTYAYPSVHSFGPFYVNPAAPQPYTSYYIFEPTGGSVPATLPVVLFLHGYLLAAEGSYGDSPGNYIYWIDHLVRNGFTVVFPSYDSGLQPTQYTGSIINAWQAALTLLQSGSVTGLIPPASDAVGMQTLFTGHSMGAVNSFAVAQQLTINPVAGVPIPRAIAGFQPGLGNTGELPTNFSQISPTVSVVVVEGDDNDDDIPTAQGIWNSVVTTIPSSNRDFLEVISDSHGSPAQLGNHWYPDTNGLNDDDSGVDDRDYNITWKLSVGLFNCVLYGTDCSYGLGHGSVNQINMGNWSDGVPVLTLSLQGGGSPSITSVTSSANPATTASPVVLTATVTAAAGSAQPTGTIVFANGSTVLGSANLAGGSASLTLSTLPLGSQSISAAYSGDINFQPSSGALVEVINSPTSAISLTSNSNPSTYNQAITFTAQVSPASATGTVAFADGTNVLSTVPLSAGTAVFTTTSLAVATHSIAATYSGNTTYPSSSATLSQVVNQDGTSLSLSSSANPAAVNQQVSFVATLTGQGAASATGTVSFAQNGSPLGSPVPIVGGQATIAITLTNSGSSTISAAYSGDSDNQASTASLIQSVGSTAPLALTTLHSFAGPDGSTPSSSLVLGAGGNFYGTTQAGGVNSLGTVFEITPAGALTTLHSFVGTDGSNPGSLVSGGDGNFYGTTATGGANGRGTVFQTTPSGVVTTLHSFSGLDGSSPNAALVLGPDGNFYGTTANGGANGTYGTIFKISSTGTFNQLYSFKGTDGSGPGAALVLGGNGNFYGSTVSGGANNAGSIFTVTSAGVLTTLYSFSGPDGSAPRAPLTLNTDGNFYGTTSNGGANVQYGTVFKITPTGVLTTIHSFAGTDGSTAEAALLLGTDGNFYSSTINGGSGGYGVLFSITPAGTITTLHSFSGSDGSNPGAGLTLGTDGNPYATTAAGAANGFGSIFRLTVAPAFSTTSVNSSASPTTYGASLTFTAAVNSLSGTGVPTGSVTFADSGNPLGTVAITGGTAAFTTSTLSPGPHSISVTYGGDGNFKPSSGTLAQSISQLVGVAAVASSLNPSVYGQSVTLSATITPPQGAPIPTGTVTFTNGATQLGMVTLAGGSASLTTSGLGGGTQSISVAYSGDANYSPATATLSQIVNTAGSTASLVSSVNPSAFGQLVTLTAVVTPGSAPGTPTGTMTFMDGGTILGAVPLSAGSASFATAALGSGTHSLTAAYSGDGNFQPSTGVLSQVVSAATTTIILTSSENPSNYLQPVRFSATVSSPPGSGTPTGTVVFTSATLTIGTVTLTGGTASITTDDLPTGSRTVSAQYQGNASFQLSSVNLSQQVNTAATAISLSSSLNPATVGSQITFTATLTGQYGGTPTGTVTFFENGTPIGSAVTVSARKASTVTTFSASGTYAITAVYSGDTKFAGATSSPLSEKVNLYATKTTIVSSGSPSLAGAPVTFTATVTASPNTVPNGEQVTFYNGSTSLGTGETVNGVATLTTSALPRGTDSITATYAGDSTLQSSTSAALKQVVTLNPTTTTLSSNLNPSIFPQSVTFSVTVTSAGPTPTGTVLFKNGTTAIGTASLSGGVATFSTSGMPAGTNSITAEYEGNSFSGESSSTALAQIVKPAPTKTTIASSLNPSTPGAAVTFTAKVAANGVTPSGSITFAYGATTLGTVTLAGGGASLSTSTLPVGNDTITATFNPSANFAGSSASLSQTVN